MSRPWPNWAVGMWQGVLISFTVAVMLVTFFVSFPAIESRYFPVVSTLQIGQVQLTTEGRSIVYGSFTKLRACEYLGTTWFKRTPDGMERVSLELLRSPGDNNAPTRPLGTQFAGPWTVGLSPDELKEGSIVQLLHRCHPFWTTVTNFYP